MATRKRHSGHAADFRHPISGERIRVSGFKTELAAQVWELEAKAALLTGKPMPPKPSQEETPDWTLEQMLEFAFTEHWATKADPSFFRKNINVMVADLGANTPAIEFADADGYAKIKAACEARGNAPGTVNRKASLISKAVKIAIEKGKLQGIIKPQFARLPESAGRERVLTLEEEKVWLDWLRQCLPDMADWFLLCIDCGTRVYSEALHVYPHHDIRGKNLLIRGRSLAPNVEVLNHAERRVKTGQGKSRQVGMTKRVAEMISRRAEKIGRNDPLFAGTDLKKESLTNYWNKAKVFLKMDDPDLVPYSLRHTFGTRMILAGNSVPATRDAMGHTTDRQTWKYVHLAGQLSAEAATKLDDYLEGAKG